MQDRPNNKQIRLKSNTKVSKNRVKYEKNRESGYLVRESGNKPVYPAGLAICVDLQIAVYIVQNLLFLLYRFIIWGVLASFKNQ